jgi:hypothetical protein
MLLPSRGEAHARMQEHAMVTSHSILQTGEQQARHDILSLSDAILFEVASGGNPTTEWQQLAAALGRWRTAYMQQHEASQITANREFVEDLLPKLERLANSVHALMRARGGA